MPNKFIANYLLSVFNTIIGLLLPIITFPYISRILEPDKIGLVNFVTSYGYYFMHIASFGISSYAVREIARIRNNKEAVRQTGNEIFNINILFSFLSGLFYLAIVVIVPRFRENFLLFALYSLTIFTNFLLLDWLFQAYDDYAFTMLRSLIVRILSIVFVFIFVKKESDFVVYMMILTFSEMGSRLSNYLYARRKYINFSISYRFLNFARHIKSLFTLFSFRIINGISSNLDKIMLGLFMTYYEVGIYSTGIKFVFLVIPLIENIGLVLFPKITISAKNSPERYLENLKFNYKIILLLGIPMFIGLFLVSPELLLLFAGERFAPSIIVSRIMAICILLVPIGDMFGSKTLLVFNKDSWLLISSSIVVFCNIVFNFIGIPLFGIVGACVASILCYFIAVAIRFIFTRKIIKFNLFPPELFKYSLFTVPFIVLYFVFQNSIRNSVTMLLGFIFTSIVIYFLELLLSKDKTVILVLSKLKTGKK